MTDTQPEYLTFRNHHVRREEALRSAENAASERERPRLRDLNGNPIDGVLF